VSQLACFVRLVIMTIFIRPWLYWIPAALPWLGLGRTVFPKQISLQRLSGMQAGLLWNWRRRLAASNRARAATAAYFSRLLPLQCARDDGHPYLRLPIVASNAEEKDRLLALSQKRGLGLALAYPTPVNEIPEIRSAFDGQRFPTARTVSERLVTLPTHPWLSERDKRAIGELCLGVRAA
jgi:dTDP-4-amino-4,6-dideoxygalactose transaminase